MIRIFLLFLILATPSVWAKSNDTKPTQKTYLMISPLQYGFRYVKQLNTDIIWQGLPSFGVGGQWQKHSVFLDHTQTSDSSGNPTLAFKKERVEWMLSYRYAVMSFTPSLDLQVGMGLGMYSDTLKSRLGAQEISEDSGYQMSGLGMVGISGRWNYLFYGAELQALAGKDFDPQPTLGGLIRVGVQFAIF